QTLGALIQEVQDQYGQLALIVIDTLSRALAGGDENSSTDLGRMVKVSDAVVEQSGAHVSMVHHSGKDQSRGARGHSLLRASVSTEIELTKMDGVSFATATKQRDQEPAEPFAFVLESMELGQDQDGDAVTTAVVRAASEEDAKEAKQKKRPGGKNQMTIWHAFKQLRADNVGKANPSGTGWPESGTFWCIEADQLRDFARGKMNTPNSRSAYDKAMDALLGSGLMAINENFIWMTTKEGRHRV
ncbi:MAG: AAA family ATPase, partial [Paracoccaceae bacterium]